MSITRSDAISKLVPDASSPWMTVENIAGMINRFPHCLELIQRNSRSGAVTESKSLQPAVESVSEETSGPPATKRIKLEEENFELDDQCSFEPMAVKEESLDSIGEESVPFFFAENVEKSEMFC